MRMVSWNMNYWMNTHIYDPEKDRYKHPSYKNNNEEVNAWINNCKKYIQELDAEIILLQEINPFTLFGIKYDKNDQNQYKIIQDNRIIFYHELYHELFDEELKENFWGNAIIINRNSIACVENNITLKSNDYYGRNGLMSYDFVSEKGTGITIINYKKCKKN
jgi:hypothetical protein